MPIVVVMIALLAQWARSDQREADRLDRSADSGSDDDLDAYNAMLAELAFRDLEARQSAERGTPDRQSPPPGG